ncbi:hypothetical protein BVY04_02695 [bacterium M21]|nr:hypothetical protein BVY04_02695 [bacterium M21]
MNDLGYINTRVKSMQCHLFPRESVEEMVELPDLGALADYLFNSPYQDELSVSMKGAEPRLGIEVALERQLAGCFNKILTMAGGGDRALFRRILGRGDIQVVKTILRGLNRNGAPEDIIPNVGTGVDLSAGQITELIEAADVTAAVELLVSWRSPLGSLLHSLLPQYREKRQLASLELALDRDFYATLSKPHGLSFADAEILQKLIATEVEVKNICRVLATPGDRHEVELLQFGSRTSSLIGKLRETKSIDEAIVVLSDSRYRRIVDKALPLIMMGSGSLVMLERFLDEVLIQESRLAALQEPLSIAVIVHFARLKQNEVMNVGMICSGIANQMPRNTIRAALVFATQEAVA